MKKNGNLSSAVMNQRAPRLCDADDATRALWRSLDWFATPPWATRAGAELVKQLDPRACAIWEPAAGDGIMADVLEEYFPVCRSDIHPQRCNIDHHDFLAPTGDNGCDWIITNPPFALAKQFAEHALTLVSHGVALLCRLNWLESAHRYPLFRAHLHSIAVFSERVPMQLGPWDPDCSSATAYAWFFFGPLGDAPVLRFVPPGTRERLTRPDDIRRFCKQTDAPLLSSSSEAVGHRELTE